MHVQFCWPNTTDFPLRENVFLGGWHPTESLRLEWTEPPATIQPALLQQHNWFLLSNRSSLHPHTPGLIHASADRDNAIAFRGYILDPPLHSYSPSSEILRYWNRSNPHSSEHNGVFSAASIHNSGQVLELCNDAFGMAPLYYRLWRNIVLFATNPRYLSLKSDRADYISWRSLLQAGFIPHDRTLSTSIKRVPAGCALRFKHIERPQVYQWFDYETLPKGLQAIDEQAVEEVEAAFQKALSRCLSLEHTNLFFPLTSGYDSRRILAALLDRRMSFQAATVHDLDKGDRNLDAYFASLMAKELGFPHYVIKRQEAIEYARDDRIRRLLLSGESPLHTWAVPLMRNLPDSPTIFLDGLAGDVFGETGFDRIAGIHQSSPEVNRALIGEYAITNAYDTVLHPAKWPSADSVRQELLGYINATLPETPNQADLAFLLLRTRRAIAPWAQQMLPAGHVVVCPYLELDYVRTILRYRPIEKLTRSLQSRCLQRFWPQLFFYPGSKAIPASHLPREPLLRKARDVACFRRLCKELREIKEMPALKGLLHPKANVRFWFAQHSDRMASNSFWAYRQLLEMLSCELRKTSCWNMFQDDRKD